MALFTITSNDCNPKNSNKFSICDSSWLTLGSSYDGGNSQRLAEEKVELLYEKNISIINQLSFNNNITSNKFNTDLVTGPETVAYAK